MPSPSWRPAASREMLELRARLLDRLRAFFAARGVLEVETPLLGEATVTDPHLASLTCCDSDGRRLYLQTSPEYAMKRLLAAGSGAIYQICKAFRAGEAGRRHNPEFTMLEWYRPGLDHHLLIDEVDALLRELLGTPEAERRTYREIFREHCDLDPHTASPSELRTAAERLGLAPLESPEDDRDIWLDLLTGQIIEPRLGRERPTVIHDYPASQAALARLSDRGDVIVAERFEVYVEGVELANGYHELTDAAEQRRRFEVDLERRRSLGLPHAPVDERLLAALDSGMPSCAGISIGVDRLLLLYAGASSLSQTLAFPAGSA